MVALAAVSVAGAVIALAATLVRRGSKHDPLERADQLLARCHEQISKIEDSIGRVGRALEPTGAS